MIEIIEGDSREATKNIPDNTADVVITSPPYFNQRDYGTGRWTGGDPDCNHINHKDVVKKATSNSTLEGSLSRQMESAIAATRFRHTCGKCGAKKEDLQIGLEHTPEEFTKEIFNVMMDAKRILKPWGTAWLNMGDSYCSTAPGVMTAPMANISGIKKETANARRIMRPATPAGLKPKDLIGIPWRIAYALQGFAVVPFYRFSEWAELLRTARETNDWELVAFVENTLRHMDLMNMLAPYWHRCDIIWAKKNPMPESVNDRPTKSHEYIFLLTKNAGKPLYWTHRELAGTNIKPKPDYRWINHLTGEEVADSPANWKQKIKCPDCAGSGKVRVDYGNGTMPHIVTEECTCCKGNKEIVLWDRSNLWVAHDYYYDAEAIKTENKGNEHDKRGTQRKRFPSKKVNGIRKSGYYPNANKRSVWSITTSAYNDDHFATFPPSLIVDCIRAGSSEHGCCAECGYPYVRVMEKVGAVVDPRMKSKRGILVAEQYRGVSSAQGMLKTGLLTINKTTGWRRTCNCATKEIKPAVVFDPFAGTGTTLEVAEKLGRDSIGIELNPKSIRLAKKRQHKAFGLFMKHSVDIQ